MDTYGAPLRAVMEKRGYTPAQLADDLGVARQSVSAWLNDRAVFPVHRLVDMADLLGVTTDEILGRETPGDNYVSRVYAELNREGRESLELQAELHYMNPRFLPQRLERKVRP